MIYRTANDWRAAKAKRILFFGMSGLGKTHVSNLLRASGNWFHYSVDYRIGTRYMGEHIVDNCKAVAMQTPFLADLLRSDSIYIASNITFNNLEPLSTYLGKPGNPALGGLPFDEYLKRQDQHREAEIAALLDTAHFAERARRLYGYDHFVCDSSGSICEIVDPADPADPVLTRLSETVLMVWIRGTTADADRLVKRFEAAPKPMCYQPDFLIAAWENYLKTNKKIEGEVDPDDFIRSTFAKALEQRQPRYAAIAENWGIGVDAADIARVETAADVEDLIARALEAR